MFCRRCGARLQQGVLICPECGARQKRQPTSVRCAHCHGRAPIGLKVCPHCGRDVRPAGPRWGLLGAAVGVIVVSALWGLGRLPLDDARAYVSRARSNLDGLVEIIDPDLPTPGSVAITAGERVTPPFITPEVNADSAVDAGVLTGDLETDVSLGNTSTALPVDLSGEEPITPSPDAATASPLQTPAPVETAMSAQLQPADTATIEPIATPDSAQYYTVRSGDTLLAIAARLDVSVQQLIEANALRDPGALQIGQKLRVPEPTAEPTPTSTPTAEPTATLTPTAEPTATPTSTRAAIQPTETVVRQTQTAVPPTETLAPPTETPTPPMPTPSQTLSPTPVRPGSQVTYRIRAGDTLSKIGEQFGIPWQDIASANGLTGRSRLNVGQILIIPVAGAQAQPTPTVAPKPTEAASPPTSVPEPYLPAPVLDSPADSTPFSGDARLVELKWLPVPGIPSGAQYQVTIRWTEKGLPQEYQLPPTVWTSVNMPRWLFGKADQPTRRYAWQVAVVQVTTDGKGGERIILLSPPSAPRTLEWH